MYVIISVVENATPMIQIIKAILVRIPAQERNPISTIMQTK
jgi:hypothetical protein